MKITIFPSDKGDCLLVESDGARPTRMLVDGGMRSTFSRHVAPVLSAAGGSLDVVYVSHIDEDHISGVLQLLDDLTAWRIHDHQRANGIADFPQPEVPRPPEIGEIWHNGFREQVSDNEGEIERLLAATATVLSGHPSAELRKESGRQRDLATSERQAVLLQRRIGDRQLGIPLNRPADGRLMMVREPAEAFQVGPFEFRVLAPFEPDLDLLRKRWNAWLKKNADLLRKIRRVSEEQEELLGTNEIDRFTEGLTAAAKALGNRKDVTVPNLASLMLLVEEAGRTLLLTGDGHAADILKGLRHHGLADGTGLHVDVLKIQHHGATANIDEEFAAAITADHYIFCGNGEHENPEIDVVKLILDSRASRGPRRSPNPEAGRPFKLWFSCSPEFPGLEASNAEHMRSIQQLVRARSRGRRGIEAEFLTDDPLVLQL